MIKDFLINKLINFSAEEAQVEITNLMPSWPNTATPCTEDRLSFWGFENNDVWYILPIYADGVLVNIDARYFEANGDIHTLGTKFDKKYYEMYKSLYDSKQVRTLIPEEFSTESDFSYIHFRKDNSTFGAPFRMQYSIGTVTVQTKDSLLAFVDSVADLWKILTSLSSPLPKNLSVFFDNEGLYFALVDELTNTPSVAIAEGLDIVQTVLTIIDTPVDVQEEVINHARTKWSTTLMI